MKLLSHVLFEQLASVTLMKLSPLQDVEFLLGYFLSPYMSNIEALSLTILLSLNCWGSTQTCSVPPVLHQCYESNNCGGGGHHEAMVETLPE